MGASAAKENLENTPKGCGLSVKKQGTAFKQWWLDNLKAIWVEFLGTALLLLFGCLGCYSAEVTKNHIIGPWGFALIILFLVFMFAKVSGAHFNPAVTILSVILKVKSFPLAFAYIIAQCLGAISGSFLVCLITPGYARKMYVSQPHGIDPGMGIAVEAFLTYILGLLCCRAWDPKNANENTAPVQFCLAIGGLAMVGAPLTGGSMNPARTLGPDVMASHWHVHYVYWAGPIIGVLCAALSYKNWFDYRPPKNAEVTSSIGVGDDVV